MNFGDKTGNIMETYSHVVGFPHRAQSIGGPGSFQTRLIRELQIRGFSIVYPGDGVLPSAILVVGGTLRIDWLIRCKRKGTKIVHRLDGINWRHKVTTAPLSFKLQSEVRNTLIRIVRQTVANEAVYQSNFVRQWWERRYGVDKVANRVVYNAVDLEEFYPMYDGSTGAPLVICAESLLMRDPISITVLSYLAKILVPSGVIRGIRVIGELGEKEKSQLTECHGVEIYGAVPRDRMPVLFREGNIFLNLDINAACPNAVVEALASGLPVVGYRTGSLCELVPSTAGRLVEYGGDPWNLDQPDLVNLANAIREVANCLDELSAGARQVAEARFSVVDMVNQYISVLKLEKSGQKNNLI